MKEFFELLKRFDLRGIFIAPTKNAFLQFFRYLFVGGIATIADWGVLYLLTDVCAVHYMISAVVSFIVGLIVNFVLSKLFVFKAQEARTGAGAEFLSYAAIGVVGLGITELIMYVFTNVFALFYMLSKVIATVIVLAWNYLARKILIYRN